MDSPCLYSSNTVNTPRVIGAHTPFFNITAIVSLRKEKQDLYVLLFVYVPYRQWLRGLIVIMQQLLPFQSVCPQFDHS